MNESQLSDWFRGRAQLDDRALTGEAGEDGEPVTAAMLARVLSASGRIGRKRIVVYRQRKFFPVRVDGWLVPVEQRVEPDRIFVAAGYVLARTGELYVGQGTLAFIGAATPLDPTTRLSNAQIIAAWANTDRPDSQTDRVQH